MANPDSVRFTRDGDQFHYYWASRLCLQLLPGTSNLVAVTIEGASANETSGPQIQDGEQLIDVGLYYGSEDIAQAQMVRYVQLKHSTVQAQMSWTASGLKKTLAGFGKRYEKLKQLVGAAEVARRFQFEFTTNRPIDFAVVEALADLSAGSGARHAKVQETLVKYSGLSGEDIKGFFAIFSTSDNAQDLWAQRNLLLHESSAYLPDLDCDAPVQLKELVTRKATSEFKTNPTINKFDVLGALKVTEDRLAPAPHETRDLSLTLPREQESCILDAILAGKGPLVIHAEGGVGKSVLAARLAAQIPAGHSAVLYDCFGDGLYRSSVHSRHRHRSALVQIANELASRGLCHPLLPTQADVSQYMAAFVGRMRQAVTMLRAGDANARLCVIVDAADNAEMAARENGEPFGVVRDLIRTPMPDGVRLVFTCRTHRRMWLDAPPDTEEIELQSFSVAETGLHLRQHYPQASDENVAEFSFLTCANPRVQANALERKAELHVMLRELGPEPTSVNQAIRGQLDRSLARMKDVAGKVEASQITLICQALAVLRPLVPIAVLAELSTTSESAVRTFALEFGRPLLVKGNSVHFLDEPTETWFRETFKVVGADLTGFLERLRPLTDKSSYAASALPQLLLQAGRLEELVTLALSGGGLPSTNQLERRDVELQRLVFAIKAALQGGHHLAAARLALRAGGERAGARPQIELIQENTDLAGALLAQDRIEDVVARRGFRSAWMGSQHAYNAGLLAGREEFHAEAASHLRMALDWLSVWSRTPSDGHGRKEPVSNEDISEIAMTFLRLRGAEAAVNFLRGWTPRHHSLLAGRILSRKLIELGRFDQLSKLVEVAERDLWLLLGLIAEAVAAPHAVPRSQLVSLLRRLSDRRITLQDPSQWNHPWMILDAVRAAVEVGVLRLQPRPEWAALVRRYLPAEPPPSLARRFDTEDKPLVLRAYALEASLLERPLVSTDIAPAEVRKHIEAGRSAGSSEGEYFVGSIGGLLPWYSLYSSIVCGRYPASIRNSVEQAGQATSAAWSRLYQDRASLVSMVAIEWMRILTRVRTEDSLAEAAAFTAWLEAQEGGLAADTLISLCRLASQSRAFTSLALNLGARAHAVLETSREDAQTRAKAYVGLARAIMLVSAGEAGAFLDRAVAISSRIGDENIDRWVAFIRLAEAAGERGNPRPRTAYRFARMAELVRSYVERDKHFPWESTAAALVDLCGSSALCILSRWRDRRFGDPDRLLPAIVYRLVEKSQAAALVPVVLSGIDARWARVDDLERALQAEEDPARRKLLAAVAYRYLRVIPSKAEVWNALKSLCNKYGFDLPDLDRLAEVATKAERAERPGEDPVPTSSQLLPELPSAEDEGRSQESPPMFPAPMLTKKQEQEGTRRWVADWDVDVFKGGDLTDKRVLRAAYDEYRSYDPPYDTAEFLRQALSRVADGQRALFIQAVARWPDFDIHVLRDLLEVLPWPPKQISVRVALRETVLMVCRRTPQFIHRRGWYVPLPFDKLYAEGLVLDREVVQAALEGFAEQADRLGAGDFFQLVEPLAACLSEADADNALNAGLDQFENALKPSDGDGPWSLKFQPPPSIGAALAGYVWAGLGAPVAAERWRCAHVVRALVELGHTDLLEQLVSVAQTRAATPFVDARLEFYAWHARQWLVLGLARGALENAFGVGPAVRLLKECLREKHVVIRKLAADTLRALQTGGKVGGLTPDELAIVYQPNEAQMGYSAKTHARLASDGVRPRTDEDRFSFSIDIGPYWFSPLGRVFGISQSNIEDQAIDAIRRELGWHEKIGWRSDARRELKIYDEEGETSHSHGSLPATDDLIAYQSYHAMMFVASGLLSKHPILRRADWREDEGDPLRNWLEEYLPTRADGKWIADLRSPMLVPRGHAGHFDKTWRWDVTSLHLDRQLVADDGPKVLWGEWDNGDSDHRESVSVRSALVSLEGARSLLAALQTVPRLDWFTLPRAEDEGVDSGVFKLKGWVSERRESNRLDGSDPWGSGVYYPGPVPSVETVTSVSLTERTDGQVWSSVSGGIVRSERWSYQQGYGRELDTVSGSRLSACGRFLGDLVTATSMTLILRVEVRRSTRGYARGNDDEEFRGSGGYTQPYVRYYTMGADGAPEPI